MSSRPDHSTRRAGQGLATIATFASVTSGVGRTAAIANLAVILAAAGHRVLVVDWTSESVTVDDYLRRFQSDTISPPQEIVDSTERVLRGPGASDGAPRAATWRTVRYQLPEGMGRIHMVTRSERWRGWLPQWPDRTQECAVLGGMLRTAGYDYVLIDGPTTVEDAVAEVFAQLSDIVIVTFLMGRITIEAAASLAGRMHESMPTLRLVAVPCQVDLDQRAGLERERERVRRLFGQYGAVTTPTEIPYRPVDLFEGILATLADEPADPGALTPAYERLAALITDGAVRTLKPPSRASREQYRQAMGLSDRSETRLLSLVYAPEDRAWADWVGDRLESAGARVQTATGTPRALDGPLVLIASPNLPDLSGWLDAQPTSDSSPVILRVTAQGPAVPPEEVVHEIPLADIAEDRARYLLLSHFNLLEPINADSGPAVPSGFPAGSGPQFVSVPWRTGDFIVRNRELEALRDRLRIVDGTARNMIIGPAGVGKSELARQYVLRFRADYQIIWWLRATDATTVRAGLSALAARLGVDPAGDTVRSVLDNLAAPEVGRWLLIYDDVLDPAELEPLVPRAGRGHVIMTGRAGRPGAEVLAPLETEEASALLVRRAGPIGAERAERIVSKLGGAPFALNLAAAWLEQTVAWLRAQGVTGVEDAAVWAAAEFLARLGQAMADREEAPFDASPSQVPDVSSAVTHCLAVTLNTLGGDPLGRLTVRLLELCTWLSSDEIGSRLLASPPMLAELQPALADHADVTAPLVDQDGLAIDAYPLQQALWMAARYGLIEITWGKRPTLRVSRTLQDAMRVWMGDGLGRTRRAQVLRALAALAPSDMAPLEDNSGTYQELHQHLHAAGAAESTQPQVRRWLVNYFRYIGVAGDRGGIEAATALAEQLAKTWKAQGLEDDPLTLRLHRQIASLKRSMGDYTSALKHSHHALVELRRTLGLTHPLALVTARGMAADLRGLGRFTEALAEDRAAHASLARELGPDHPETLLTLYNLAISAFLAGDRETALHTVVAAYHRRILQYGEDDWRALWIQRECIDFRREHERTPTSLETARRQLVAIRQKLMALHSHRRRDEFMCVRSLAIVERLLGKAESALTLDREAREGFRQQLGRRHPDTFAVSLSLAADLNAMHRHAQAVEEARAARDGFMDLYQERHPFVAVCQTDLAVILLDAGHAQESLPLAEEASRVLEEELGGQHPWAMAARINYSRSLVAVGEIATALELDELTYDDANELLGGDHPYTEQATEAMNDSRRRLAQEGPITDAAQRPALHVDVPSP